MRVNRAEQYPFHPNFHRTNPWLPSAHINTRFTNNIHNGCSFHSHIARHLVQKQHVQFMAHNHSLFSHAVICCALFCVRPKTLFPSIYFLVPLSGCGRKWPKRVLQSRAVVWRVNYSTLSGTAEASSGGAHGAMCKVDQHSYERRHLYEKLGKWFISDDVCSNNGCPDEALNDVLLNVQLVWRIRRQRGLECNRICSRCGRVWILFAHSITK